MENNNWKWYEQNIQANGGERGADDAAGRPQDQGDGGYGVQQGGASYNSGETGCAPYEGSVAHKQPKRHEAKKRFGLMQLFVAMLVVALLAGAAGAGLATLAQGYAQQSGEVSNDNPTENAGGVVIDKDAAGGDKASEGITLGSVWTGEDTVAEMLQKCMSSVVGIDIISEVSTGSDWYGSSGTTSETVGSGSGVILTSDGYIVTCNHVVAQAGAGGTIKVYLQDGTAYDATIVGSDDMTDLAVIKIEAANLPTAAVGSSSKSVVGDTVYAIGNPLGVLASSVTDGIVSGLDRLVTINGIDMTCMQTDAAVNPGNSGGGLFNSSGELIGIVNAKATGENVEGIGFAIPIDSALSVIRDLMDLGYVSGRPFLGITPVDVYMTAGSPSYFGFSNYVTRVQVYAVDEGSPADQAGLKAGDVLLTFDGKDVFGSSDLSAILYEYNIGDTVTITVLRDREQIDLTVTLGERAG
ncbi:MAG TPA: trypsin-like peptidase domain-containing protein [Clostridia bacterium]|nr:trypsin-like peptidase domain-containing protein [Clostridia bacterium]